MKNRDFLFESRGIIDKDGKQWFDLTEIIVDYIYDLQHGLNNEQDEQPIITKGNIESYYLYKFNKNLPDYVIPKWIYSFKVFVKNDLDSRGSFLRKSAKLSDTNQLIFDIEINESLDPDIMCNVLVHEFQHAYTHWLELYKKIKFHTKAQAKLYNYAQDAFNVEKYGNNGIPMAKMFFVDNIDIDDSIFEDSNHLERSLLFGFYLSNKDEIRSFLQEFSIDMMHKVENKVKTIQKEIKKSLEFKGDFNNLSPENKWKSNILNNISVTCYDSAYYKRYKAYYNFYKKLAAKQLDDIIADKVVYTLRKPIKLYLGIPLYKKLIHYDGDSINILHKIAIKQMKILENVIKQMHNIYAKIIMDIPVK